MELILVFAAATGRTLVLPPDQPMYLLHHGKGHQKHHNFADFFPFEIIKQRVNVISMTEYMLIEGITGNLKQNGQSKYPPHNKTSFDGTEKLSRNEMYEYLRNVSSCPLWRSMWEYLVIPEVPGRNSSLLSNGSIYDNKRNVFASGRIAHYYDNYWIEQKSIHFISNDKLNLRLLEHFYTFIHFENDFMDRYYKRFVRDYVHYVDLIFCKASLIIAALQYEGNGSYSSFHIRR